MVWLASTPTPRVFSCEFVSVVELFVLNMMPFEDDRRSSLPVTSIWAGSAPPGAGPGS